MGHPETVQAMLKMKKLDIAALERAAQSSRAGPALFEGRAES